MPFRGTFKFRQPVQKHKACTNWPPLGTTLQAIELEKGIYPDIPSQKKFLRRILEPEYTQDIPAEQIPHRMERIREWLANRIRGNTTESPAKKPYNIGDLFVLGPSAVLPPNYLAEVGYYQQEESSKKHSSSERNDEAPDPGDTSKAEGLSSGKEEKRARSEVVASISVVTRQNDKDGDGANNSSPDSVLTAPREKSAPAHLPTQRSTSTASLRRPLEDAPRGESTVGKGSLARVSQKSQDTQPIAADPTANASKKRKEAQQGTASDGDARAQKKSKTEKTTVAETPTESAASPAKTSGETGLGHKQLAVKPLEQEDPVVLEVPADKTTLLKTMERIEDLLRAAQMSYFQQHGIDPKAPANFVIDPSPELRTLYKRFVGNKRWEKWSVEQYDSLRQDRTILGLFGAFVYKDIFGSQLAWDLPGSMLEAAGRNVKYLDAAIQRLDPGADLKSVLKDAAETQIACPEFQGREVAEYAQERAGSLDMTLRRHLKMLSKKKPDDKSTDMAPSDKPWMDLLEEAFSHAIVAKQWMRSSTRGPFYLEWPAAGEEIDRNRHRPLSELQGGERVLHTILPVLLRSTKQGKVPWCNALVVPSRPATTNEAEE